MKKRIFKKAIWKTLPSLYKKQGILIQDCVESTPIVFNNQMYIIGFDRSPKMPFGDSVYIYSVKDQKRLQTFPWKFGLGCAFVSESGDRIHIFGSSQWDKPNYIAKTELVFNENTDSFEIQETKKIWESTPKQSIYNSSVGKGKDGYYMAYEVREPDKVNFSVRFLKSTDLENWGSIGTIFHPDIYAACPTIRFFEDWYYIIYLRNEIIGKNKKGYAMCISRTQDFQEFQDFEGNDKYSSETAIVSPFGSTEEGINNSDVDLVEFNGITYLIYADGDQRTWAHLRVALFLGTMGEFFKEFWPK